MRRPNKDSTPKMSAESTRLITYAQSIVQAASRFEERYWEHNLDTHLQKILKANHQDNIDAALNQLATLDLNAYDALMEAVEAMSESCALEQEENGQIVNYEALLIVAPILAWTRFSIASGPIPAEVCSTLSAQMSSLLLADGVKLALAPNLYSIDQMPRSHGEAYALTLRLAQAALKNTALHPNKKVPETAPFLADTRYLIAVLVVPQGSPFFRWQMPSFHPQFIEERARCLQQWQTQAIPHINRLLPGCGVELLLPEAYYIACREADKAVRPISIRAAVHYLTHSLAIEADGLRAVIAGFGDELSEGMIDEFRVAFTLVDNDDVLYGIVWPIYGLDEEEGVNEGMGSMGGSSAPSRRETQDEISSLLQQAGVTQIKRHSTRFASEYCDDCGTPLFADPTGELVHPEMPEDMPPGGAHFH